MDTALTDGSELTAEMVEAGVNALMEYDPRFEGMEEAVIRIFWSVLTGKIISPKED